MIPGFITQRIIETDIKLSIFSEKKKRIMSIRPKDHFYCKNYSVSAFDLEISFNVVISYKMRGAPGTFFRIVCVAASSAAHSKNVILKFQ